MTQTLLNLVDQHLVLAYVFLFLVCMGEALFVVGLFVPSTVVLVAAGAMIGAGKLPFLPVLGVAAAGAVAGDALSYWIGHHYRDRLRGFGPFKRYGALIDKGEAFFHRHGGKSVFLGRFVPGVKAIVPGIAGMAGMRIPRFATVNVVSAFAWAAAHLIPAAGVGLGLSRIHSLDPRLAILAAGGVLLLLIAWYLGKILIGFVAPLASGWRRSRIERRSRVGTWLARLEVRYLSNEANIVGRTAVLVLAALAAGVFLLLLGNLLLDPELKLADNAVYNLLQGLRTKSGTDIVTAITMAADGFVLTALTVALVAWLAFRRHFRVAIAAALTMAGSEAFVHFVKGIIQRPRPTDLYTGVSSFSFPSGHATLSMTFFGILAVIITSRLRPTGRVVTFGAAILGGLTIAFSRMYLGAHWLSDVSAGLSFGLLMTAIFALTTHRRDRSIRIGPLAGVLVIVFTGFYGFHLWRDYGTWTGNYAPVLVSKQMTEAEWRNGGWRDLPRHRLTIGGDEATPIIFQTDLDPHALAPLLQPLGWSRVTTGGLLSALVPSSVDLNSRPALPVLHEGRMPVATFDRTTAEGRNVLSLWPSSYRIGPDASGGTILLAGCSHETAEPFGFGMSFSDRGECSDIAAVRSGLEKLAKTNPADILLVPSSKDMAAD